MHAEGRSGEAYRYCARRSALIAGLERELRERHAAIAEGFAPTNVLWPD